MRLNWTSMIILAVLSFMILATGCAQNENDDAQPTAGSGTEAMNQEAAQNTQADIKARANMRDVHGETIGTVEFITDHDKTVVSADLKHLKPGWHGFHLHRTSSCEPVAHVGAFAHDDGHYHPDRAMGDDEGHGHHAGDMPLLYANEDGTVKMSIALDKFTVEQLLNDGVAVMIHENPDNFGHIPERYQSEDSDSPGADEVTMKTGDAGERIACGTLQAAEK